MTDVHYNPAAIDADGLTAAQRFDQLRDFFLAKLAAHGFGRPELFKERRWGIGGFYSEEEFVRQWVEKLEYPLRHIFQGIEACYANAKERGLQITSFRFTIPWIIQRTNRGTPL